MQHADRMSGEAIFTTLVTRDPAAGREFYIHAYAVGPYGKPQSAASFMTPPVSRPNPRPAGLRALR